MTESGSLGMTEEGLGMTQAGAPGTTRTRARDDTQPAALGAPRPDRRGYRLSARRSAARAVRSGRRLAAAALPALRPDPDAAAPPRAPAPALRRLRSTTAARAGRG